MSQRIAFIAPNWLGDAVMAFPAIGAVRQCYPDATLVAAARTSTAALFQMVDGVNEVVVLGRGWAGEAATLAAARADVLVLFPNSFRSAWVARRAGIPERWGFAADLRRPLLTRAVPRPRGRRHQVDYYKCLTSGLGMSIDAPPVRLVIPDEGRARAAALLARAGVPAEASIVGMAPGAAYGRAKQWPPEKFADVAARLHERLGVVSVLVGTRADRDVARDVVSGPHVVNLIGDTDLPALVGLLGRCRAFLSNDSGAMHVAAAAGVPVTAIFGATDERGTAPRVGPSALDAPHEILTCNVWCRPCMLRECPIDHRCMTGIDAGRAADALERQLRLTPETPER
jgi:heptosyltransferase II